MYDQLNVYALRTSKHLFIRVLLFLKQFVKEGNCIL